MVVTRGRSESISMLDDESKAYLASLIDPLARASQIEDLVRQLNEQAKRIGALEGHVQNQANRIEQLELQVQAKNVQLADAANLQSAQSERIDDIEQYTRRYSVRVNGLPAPKLGEKEDISKIVQDCCEEMGIEMQMNEIDRMHRVGPVVTDQTSKKKSQSVIIKFRHWGARCDFYRKRPKFEAGRRSPFKVALDLTRRRYSLLNSAIEKVKSYPDIDFVCVDINCLSK